MDNQVPIVPIVESTEVTNQSGPADLSTSTVTIKDLTDGVSDSPDNNLLSRKFIITILGLLIITASAATGHFLNTSDITIILGLISIYCGANVIQGWVNK